MLGKKFGIVTPYTSYLVVEDTPVPHGQPRQVWGQPEEERMREPVPPPATVGPMGLGGTGATAAAPMPKKAARARYESVFSEAKGDAFGAATGANGIAVAQATRDMKEKDSADEGGVQSLGGHTFVYRAHTWVDTAAADKRPQTLKVKYLSAAYFALVRARGDLKGALALGDHVTVMVSAGKAIEVLPDAGEESADAVTAFLK
jgi:Ca-activated chloride channel family protein